MLNADKVDGVRHGPDCAIHQLDTVCTCGALWNGAVDEVVPSPRREQPTVHAPDGAAACETAARRGVNDGLIPGEVLSFGAPKDPRFGREAGQGLGEYLRKRRFCFRSISQ